MAKVDVHVPPTVKKTYDITGLTRDEYVAIREGLFYLWSGPLDSRLNSKTSQQRTAQRLYDHVLPGA